MTDALVERVESLRRTWGLRLLILGHHYQSPAVLRHADVTGDSLELSRKAAGSRAERIVFCGVRFMAETAVILARPEQSVYMPETTAGCPMADMADAESAVAALERLARAGGDWVPVVYVNSSAEVKAFCGRQGGSACTSSNAGRVLSHFLDRGRRVLFLPDRHLAENTAHDLGLPAEAVALYDPAAPDGGLDDAAVGRARLVCWKGHCHVHTFFTPEMVARVRRERPEARIVVHPEAPAEVVRAADAHGSTSQIIRYVEAQPAGSTVVVGTESRLVQRLADVHRGRVTVLALALSTCPNMAKTNVPGLLHLLEAWSEAQRIRVDGTVAGEARQALQRMLSL
jgi:quinolinate synthase